MVHTPSSKSLKNPTSRHTWFNQKVNFMEKEFSITIKLSSKQELEKLEKIILKNLVMPEFVFPYSIEIQPENN